MNVIGQSSRELQQPAGLISIVVPMFNEEANADELFTQLQAVRDKMVVPVELVFVDDGSQDASFELAKRFALTHARVRVLKLSRNFGSHAAVMAGLCQSTGDCVVFMAGDLQDPPALLAELLKCWESGFKIVWAARTVTEKSSSSMYWRLANWVTDNKFPQGGVDFALVDRRVVDVLVQQSQRNTCLFVQIANTDFGSTVVFFDKPARKKGKSGWTLIKKLRHVFGVLVSSVKPLRALLMICLLLCGASFLCCLLLLFNCCSTTNLLLLGITILLASHLLYALLVLMIGLLGEYLFQVTNQIFHLPRFVVADSVESVPESIILSDKTAV